MKQMSRGTFYPLLVIVILTTYGALHFLFPVDKDVVWTPSTQVFYTSGGRCVDWPKDHVTCEDGRIYMLVVGPDEEQP